MFEQLFYSTAENQHGKVPLPPLKTCIGDRGHTSPRLVTRELIDGQNCTLWAFTHCH